ncbi:MAG: FKBP-type peptidyl-prolyl cis-trans isomerase [Dermatophilaceae bacterium]
MRLHRPARAAAALLGLALLASCGSVDSPSDGATSTVLAGASLDVVSATGPVDLKTAPKVTFGSTPVRTSEVTRKVLTPGTGPVATKSDTVSVRLEIYNGTTGKLLDDGFAQGRGDEGYRLARKDLIPGFTEGLIGAQKGGRLAFAIPPAKGFGTAGNENLKISGTDTIVVIADVADVHAGLTQIDGTQAASPAGLPTVAFPDGPIKEPTITVPKTAAPTTTQVITLIQGTGKTVEKGQTLAAHYAGVLWKDGSVFDSSYARGEIADFPIGVGGVIPGWDKSLVGQKVGSRVLLVIPPKDGYGAAGSPPKISGTDTLVFVVDVLDAY